MRAWFSCHVFSDACSLPWMLFEEAGDSVVTLVSYLLSCGIQLEIGDDNWYVDLAPTNKLGGVPLHWFRSTDNHWYFQLREVDPADLLVEKAKCVLRDAGRLS